MKRALITASLVTCLAIAVLIGFVFWGGSGARLPSSSLEGTATQPKSAIAPEGSQPPLTASCNAKSSLPPRRALFSISGRCNVGTNGPAQCNASGGDDFGADYALKTTSGDTAYFSLGIEGYTGPGTYKAADVLFFVLYGLHLAQWQDPTTVVTIKADAIVLPSTLLSAAPGTGATDALVAKGTLPCGHGNLG
ncbi:MAG TPA: hypothetical protein VEJ84_07955, partial [Acidimicrobiales bacterium]|nr:hypothetical protein [Acidimicrobiales bacterium]